MTYPRDLSERVFYTSSTHPLTHALVICKHSPTYMTRYGTRTIAIAAKSFRAKRKDTW